jgi:hypothetical protein
MTHADLTRLITAAKRGMRLNVLANVANTSEADVDLVLWTKLGRSVAEACDLLNGRSAAQGSR